MPKSKHASSYMLTPEAKGLLEQLAERFGTARSAILEMAIRDFARRQLDAKKGQKNAKV